MNKLKSRLVVLSVISMCFISSGCDVRPHKAEVVQVYQEDEDANDGVVKKSWRTTIHLKDTDGRAILYGKYGNTGDTFTAWYDPAAQCWTSNP